MGEHKNWFARNKAKLPMRVPAVIVGWYFYGMFLNSLRLGITSTFHTGEDEIKSIWVLNPFKNWGAVFTGFGIVTTLVIILIICLITKKGYIWFSGYKYTHDPRGFDILPDGTHGTSGFLTEKEMREFLELSPAGKTEGMILGKVKKHPDDPDAYALYAAPALHRRAGKRQVQRLYYPVPYGLRKARRVCVHYGRQGRIV